MKKKNLFVMAMTMVSVALIGCGQQEQENPVVDAIADVVTTSESIENTESVEIEIPQATMVPNQEIPVEATDVEESEAEIAYRETEKLFLIKNQYNDGKQFDVSTLEHADAKYTLEESVDVYFLDEDLAGYTKDGVDVYVSACNEEWSYCIFEKKGYLMKTEELMAVAKPIEKTVDEATPKTPKEESIPTVSEPTMDIPVVAEPVVVESDKYTQEEAVAIYRSIMESNGITWNPALKDGGSWGTGWIYLTKGQPEWAASTDIEAYTFNGYDAFYMEIPSLDEDAVYVTRWHN